MIDAAERAGIINKRSVIVEPTSGNTGIALAFVAAARGYRLILTMPESMSQERRMLLQAARRGAGADARPRRACAAPSRRPRRSPARRRTRSFRSSSRIPPIPTSIAERRRTSCGTIPTDRSTCLISGVGTGGTITGVSEVLKQRKPSFHTVAVEPAASPGAVGRRARSAQDSGHRRRFRAGDSQHRHHRRHRAGAATRTRIKTAREVARLEGIPCGISSGAATWAALQVADSARDGRQVHRRDLPELGRALPQHEPGRGPVTARQSGARCGLCGTSSGIVCEPQRPRS